MRVILVIGLCVAAVQALPAHTGRQDELYRGPMYGSRPVDYVAPSSGGPLKFGTATLNLNYPTTRNSTYYSLSAPVQSNSIRSIGLAAITLRVAFGPTRHGMVTFRVRPVEGDHSPPFVIAPGGHPRVLNFVISPDDPAPGPLALKPHMKAAFTLERVTGDNSIVIFENPDATELLWEALGRPALSSQ
jgi:hypothetical protein